MSIRQRAENLLGEKIPADISLESFRPNLHKRNPVFQSWLYPIFGLHRLTTDWSVAKPILWSTSVALLQSAIITGGYVYISFKYVHWFVSAHLLNFSYFNLRPLFRMISTITGQTLSEYQMEWGTAAILTLFQAAILSNSLIGYKIRAQGRRAGEAVLSSKPRRKQVSVETRERQERGFAGNFLWRFVKNSLWNTFIIPIYAFPVVGQLLYAFLRAPNIAARYLNMFDAKIAKNHRYGVIGFGIVAGVLSSLPGIGHLFVITNAVGAALWIQDLEAEAVQEDDARDDTT